MGFFPEGIGNNIDMDEAMEKVMKSLLMKWRSMVLT